MYPGEYPQPLSRKTVVQCPVVSGYVAARLQAQEYHAPVVSGYSETAVQATFQNVGNTWIEVQLRETSDASITGTRYNLGDAVMLCPGGHAVKQMTFGKRKYLEVLCTGTTTGALKLELDSQARWTEMGFAKDDPYFATSLWQAKAYPTAL